MENVAAKQTIEKIKYGYKREIPHSFFEAAERTREALATEGFGVLTEIRLDEKLKEKLDEDFRKYVILGACNPPLAYKTVQQDINVGLLLPCNVIVYEADDPERSIVAAIDADAMMSVVGDAPEIVNVAREVNERLQRVLVRI